MIQLLEPLMVPNVGFFNAGEHAELAPELEKQLIASGKALEAGDFKDDNVVAPVQSHADDD